MTENIGYKLKRLREDNQFSVEDLAVQSGVQQSQIEQIETGKMLPSLATLIKLSRTLGIRLGTFLYVDSPGTADASVVGTPVQGKRL